MSRQPGTVNSPWKAKGERRDDREEKRRAVLLTAAQAFCEKGVSATSLDEIAGRLNITKPTLYRFFDSKSAILNACVQIGLDMIEEALATSGATARTGREQLVVALRSYAEIMTMEFGMCVTRIDEAELPPETRKTFRRHKRSIDERIRGLVEAGVADGSLAATDPRMATFVATGALNWIARWYDAEGALGPDEIARRCVSILVQGLEPRGSAAPGDLAEEAVGTRARRPAPGTGPAGLAGGGRGRRPPPRAA